LHLFLDNYLKKDIGKEDDDDYKILRKMNVAYSKNKVINCCFFF